MSDIGQARALAAEKWFGYGHWNAPYWFIGMEPGGEDKDADYESWLALGGEELIGCKEHHLACGCDKWFQGSRRKTQATWRRLIQVMFAFEGLATDLDAVWNFQRECLGTTDGKTALIELSALHAVSQREQVDRHSHLRTRIQRIAERMDRHPPQFALFYGLGNKERYERVTRTPFGPNRMCWHGTTLCVLAPGPTARGYSNPEFWTNLGTEMKQQVLLRGASA